MYTLRHKVTINGRAELVDSERDEPSRRHGENNIAILELLNGLEGSYEAFRFPGPV